MQRQRLSTLPFLIWNEVVSRKPGNDVPEAPLKPHHRRGGASPLPIRWTSLSGLAKRTPDLRLYGANDGAVQLASQQPQQTGFGMSSASTDPYTLSHVLMREGLYRLPFRSTFRALSDGVDFDGGGAHSKPRVGSRGRRCADFMRALGIYSSDGGKAYTPSFAIRWIGSVGHASVAVELQGRERRSHGEHSSLPHASLIGVTFGGTRSASPMSRVVVGQQDPSSSEEFLQRDHQPPGAAQHEHPHGAQAIPVGP